jgi:hypothetical protein
MCRLRFYKRRMDREIGLPRKEEARRRIQTRKRELQRKKAGDFPAFELGWRAAFRTFDWRTGTFLVQMICVFNSFGSQELILAELYIAN